MSHIAIPNPVGAGYLVETSGYALYPVYVEQLRPDRTYTSDPGRAKVFPYMDGAAAAATRLNTLESRMDDLVHTHNPFPGA